MDVFNKDMSFEEYCAYLEAHKELYENCETCEIEVIKDVQKCDN